MWALVNRQIRESMVLVYLLGGSSHLVSGLVHPNYKWIDSAYPIYNWGYNPLTKWDEPPSTAPKLGEFVRVNVGK